MATSYFSEVLSWLVPRLSKRKDMEQFQESSGSLKEEMKSSTSSVYKPKSKHINKKPIDHRSTCQLSSRITTMVSEGITSIFQRFIDYT